MSNDLEIKKFFSILFDENDCLCIGNLYNNKIKKYSGQKGEFYSINPIHSTVDLGFKKKDKYSYLKPRRADVNVTKFRNFLIEIDTLNLEEQLNIYKSLEIYDYLSIVYSGNKSYHVIISLDDFLGGVHTENGIDMYKMLWKRIAAYVNLKAGKNVCDDATKNPSRFSRFPFYTAKNRKTQEILKIGSRINLDYLISFLPEVIESYKPQKSFSNVKNCDNVEDFFKNASQGLINAFLYPSWARESAGLYPTAFKLCLWAIDEMNIDRDILINVFSYRVFKFYQKYGYPEEKWFNAINDAYNLKNSKIG